MASDEIRCKAHSKQSGERCKKTGNHVCPSCRVCRHHGCNCKNPGGAPKGNRNGLKHGLYTAGLLDGERELWGDIDVAGLDDEIRVAKIMLRRALIAQAKRDGKVEQLKKLVRGEDSIEVATELLELSRLELAASESQDSEAPELVKQVLEGRDYWNEIHRFLGRVDRLSATRSQMGGNPGIDAAETARAIQDALAEMDDRDGLSDEAA